MGFHWCSGDRFGAGQRSETLNGAGVKPLGEGQQTLSSLMRSFGLGGGRSKSKTPLL